MQQHPMQTAVGGGFPPITSVTTEVVQKYLDENKQLILAILDNQNVGKFNECAMFQAKLQANLMYLAAVADSQPQPTMHSQLQSAAGLPPGSQYAAHPQVQQQMAQQSLMGGRSSMQYTQQQVAALHQAQHQLQQHQQHQQQQAMHGGAQQHGMNTVAGINFQLNPVEAGMAASNPMVSRGLTDLGRGESMHMNRGLGTEIYIGNRQDMVGGSDAGGNPVSGNENGGSGADEAATYLKVAEDRT